MDKDCISCLKTGHKRSGGKGCDAGKGGGHLNPIKGSRGADSFLLLLHLGRTELSPGKLQLRAPLA